MAYKPKVLPVADGGTGDTSLTAYAVLCGGTTSTGAIQSIAGVGSANQVLTSNGASNLPTFQAAPSGSGGYVISVTTQQSLLADATTYTLLQGFQIGADGNDGIIAYFEYFIPKSGTITKAYGAATVTGSLGSSGNTTVFLRKNNSTNTTITSTLALTGTNNTFNNTGLSIAVTAGDYISFKITTPTWTSNPTGVAFTISIVVT